MSFLDGPAIGWLALALIAAIVEVSVPHFGLAFAAIGAVAAAGVAAIGLTLPAQIVVFAVVLTVSVLALRNRVLGRLQGPGIPSRTEQLTGKDAVVTEDIDPTVGVGRVNVGGEDWAARSGEGIGAGTRVRVVGADGIVLEVRRA
jgi:membrane protein implicated in regulation of membrane protease activity